MKLLWGGLLALALSLPAADVVKINTEKTSSQISKYVYGQFIEHLGRCIYGGIWAEMIEDRKFFFPVTDEYNPWGTFSDRQWNAGDYQYLKASPWKVIGPAGSVTMDTQRPFVGKNTPVIHATGNKPVGISQEGLEMRQGKKYTGHIVLAGSKQAGPIIVKLVFDGGQETQETIKKLSSDFQAYSFKFTAPANGKNVRIEITGQGRGDFCIGTLSLMPADNIKGWRKDVVTLLKELNSPVYRWPGGNFVSGYNWKDGIGPRDQRPPRKNPAWKGIEHNDVGIHEYMELMELIDSEAFIAVNTGLGTVEEVAEEVEYCNGAASTPMGKLRAQNGHKAPYRVKWWAVGNEMYGNWQLGHMPLSEYVKKHNRVAEAMWKVDPKIQLIGVGAVGQWSKTMLAECSGFMNLLSEHIYVKEKSNVVDHTQQLAQQIRRVAEAHRKYRQEIKELAGKDIRIAMDEWNYWYGNYIYGELGVQYFLKDGLGVAIGLHEYFRNSDIYFMANYAQTVNVIGCIKTSRSAASFETTGLALKLYRQHFGEIPVEVTGVPAPLDIAAAWSDDKKALTVGMVNPSNKAVEIQLDCGNIRQDKGNCWIISNPDPQSHNVPGNPSAVSITEAKTNAGNGAITLAPYSITLYRFPTK